MNNQSPITKLQLITNNQSPKVWLLNIGYWILSGHWNLIIGYSLRENV